MAEVIWTNHLQQRAKERHIDVRLVDQAIRFPDKVEKSRTTNSQKHIKLVGDLLTVASVKRQGNDWIVTSVWQKANHGRIVYKKPLLERLVYRLVLGLEKMIRTRLQA